MITATYYRDIITPKPLNPQELDARVTAAIREQHGETLLHVAIPRTDVEAAILLLLHNEFIIVGVLQGTVEPEAEARALRIGTYKADDFVLDTIHFKVPDLPTPPKARKPYGPKPP